MNRREAMKTAIGVVAGTELKVVDAAVGPAAVFFRVPHVTSVEAMIRAQEHLNQRLNPIGIEAFVVADAIEIKVVEGKP